VTNSGCLCELSRTIAGESVRRRSTRISSGSYLPWRSPPRATIVPGVTPHHGAAPPHRDLGGESANPALLAALDAHANGAGGAADVLSALAASRLLIPVLEQESRGVSHLESVMITADDGGPAMPAFTSEATLRRWDSRARPVPVPMRSAAEAALASGAGSLVIDVAGPVTFAVDPQDLRSLAAGWRPHGVWPAAGPTTGGEPESANAQSAGTSPASSAVVDNAGRRLKHTARELIVRPVVQRVVPATATAVARVWNAVHQRVSRIGTR
jgi:hypothetical protein